MNIAALITDPTFAVGAAFVVFMLLISKPLWKAVRGGLEQRGETISSEINEAEALRTEAESILASIKHKQKEALEAAKTIVKTAKEEAKLLQKQAEIRLEEDIERRTELAIQRVAMAEATAISDIKSNAVDVTVSAARTLIAQELDDEAATALLNRAVADLTKRTH